jgi:hypothetical protein
MFNETINKCSLPSECIREILSYLPYFENFVYDCTVQGQIVNSSNITLSEFIDITLKNRVDFKSIYGLVHNKSVNFFLSYKLKNYIEYIIFQCLSINKKKFVSFCGKSDDLNYLNGANWIEHAEIGQVLNKYITYQADLRVQSNEPLEKISNVYRDFLKPWTVNTYESKLYLFRNFFKLLFQKQKCIAFIKFGYYNEELGVYESSTVNLNKNLNQRENNGNVNDPRTFTHVKEDFFNGVTDLFYGKKLKGKIFFESLSKSKWEKISKIPAIKNQNFNSRELQVDFRSFIYDSCKIQNKRIGIIFKRTPESMFTIGFEETKPFSNIENEMLSVKNAFQVLQPFLIKKKYDPF